MAVPILLALAVLAVAAALATHYLRATSVHAEHIDTKLLPTHTVFQSDSIVVGPSTAEDNLFVATTIRLDNKQRNPAAIDTIDCTLTTANGGVLTLPAAQKDEIPLSEQSFPALKPLLAQPLLRESTISPGQALTGTVLIHFPITQSLWDARRSAVLTIGFYNQPSLTITIPKQ